jgi:hypothetical protein
MRIRRNVITLVLMMMSAAGALLAGAAAMAPVDHPNTSLYASIHDVAVVSVTTSGASPDVYYDT